MQKIKGSLTVFFDDPFWVGVYERISDGMLEVCKITFGAEPKDSEVYRFILQNWDKMRFSPPVKADCQQPDTKINPKRMQRTIHKQLNSHGTSTKSQQALQLQREENKLSRKKRNSRQKEERKEQQFALRQQKRKEKHRGR